MALFAALFVARRVVRPLGALREGVERIGRGDMSHRLQVEAADEIKVLAEEFNRMTAALQEAHAGLEQKVAERTHALLVVNERLDEASRHKSRFLASVSHELRTPLHAIIGFTRIVLRKTDGQIAAVQRENLRKVLISAEHLLALINGLLDLSRIEAGKMEIAPEVFRLDEVLDVVASTVEPLLNGGRVQLVREIAPGLPPLDTDRQKLRQIFLNLLANAAKFTEDGTISVSAEAWGDSLKLVVADTGIGMAREALDYIFEEFRRVAPAGVRSHAGTGLGLAITRQLVHLLGGTITADSEVGKGSTFTVLVPFRCPRATVVG
jgi:signal transduction histidine kinase